MGSCISNSTMGLHNPSLPQPKQLSKMWNSSQTVAFDCCLTYFLYIYPVSVLVCHICSWLVRCLQILLQERWQGTQIGNPIQNIYSEPDVLHCISCGHWPGFNSFYLGPDKTQFSWPSVGSRVFKCTHLCSSQVKRTLITGSTTAVWKVSSEEMVSHLYTPPECFHCNCHSTEVDHHYGCIYPGSFQLQWWLNFRLVSHCDCILVSSYQEFYWLLEYTSGLVCHCPWTT